MRTDLLVESPWYLRPVVWLELFLAGNLGFLAVDVYLAHAMNLTVEPGSQIPVGQFANPWEWAPVIFSVLGTLVLTGLFLIGGVEPLVATQHGWVGPEPTPVRRLARVLGLFVGWMSIAVGVAGLLFHLKSDFFDQFTLASLVYTAPFAVPLAYTGLGLLIILNRTVPSETSEWARWVLLLAMGGFVGNFVLCLTDHAQNGFFHVSEWSGVVGAALAVGFLTVLVLSPRGRTLREWTWGVLGLQIGVGVVGFALHVISDIQRPAGSSWERFVFGAPVFAPLLFADLAILAAIGLWALPRCLAREETAREAGEISAPVGRIS